MTSPNHVTGGMVFTGLFCSLFSINIFSNPLFISVCVVGSLLPDIDHTKSLIGKAFYPLAKWLSVHYGHRTITHSLLFLVGITIFSMFLEAIFSDNYSVSVILFFSVFSHFILDMVTLQGIPLFYPFYKNPCVLPANPELRIKSGNMKQEGIILFVFAFMTLFMQDLFAQGFWSTLNNNFNDIKHKVSEYKNTNKALEIEYDYTIFQDKHVGKGILVQAHENTLFILSKGEILRLDKNMSGLTINSLKTYKTAQKLVRTHLYINNLNLDEINKKTAKKFILEGKIYASDPAFLTSNFNENKRNFDLKNAFDVQFQTHLNDSIERRKKAEIDEINIKIETEKNKILEANKPYYIAEKELFRQKNALKKSDLTHFEINEIKKKIIELERFTSNFDLKNSLLIDLYEKQIFELENRKNRTISFSGEITTISVERG